MDHLQQTFNIIQLPPLGRTACKSRFLTKAIDNFTKSTGRRSGYNPPHGIYSSPTPMASTVRPSAIRRTASHQLRIVTRIQSPNYHTFNARRLQTPTASEIREKYREKLEAKVKRCDRPSAPLYFYRSVDEWQVRDSVRSKSSKKHTRTK